jgi:hypothetical protein
MLDVELIASGNGQLRRIAAPLDLVGNRSKADIELAGRTG